MGHSVAYRQVCWPPAIKLLVLLSILVAVPSLCLAQPAGNTATQAAQAPSQVDRAPSTANATANKAANTAPAASRTAAPSAAKNGSTPAAAASQGPDQQIVTGLLQHRGQDIFLTGVNLGNIQFIPFEGNPYGYSVQEMQAILDGALADIASTGANSVRFWLHIDGSRSPAWSNQQVSGLPAGFINDLKWFLRTAYQRHKLLVSVSLWSHDILAVRRLNPEPHRDRAIRMMSDDAATAAYINNALVPMLQALREEMSPGGGVSYLDAVVAWEVLNEPEGISKHWRLYKNYQYGMRYGNYTWGRESWELLRRRNNYSALAADGGAQYTGWYFVLDDVNRTFNNYMYHDVIDPYPSEFDFLRSQILTNNLVTKDVPYQKVLRFMNKVSGAIHRAAPGSKVTIGAHSIPYVTDIPMPGLPPGWQFDNVPFNYYSDSNLIGAGGDPDGVMDLYQVHGYPLWNEPVPDTLINMFLHSKSHWRLNKPLIVGEHWDQVLAMPTKMVPKNYIHLHDTGYAGAWGWAWFNVSETYNPVTGTASRAITPHVNQGFFRSLLAALPARLRYPLRQAGNANEAVVATSG